jgi:hypothetical protein
MATRSRKVLSNRVSLIKGTPQKLGLWIQYIRRRNDVKHKKTVDMFCRSERVDDPAPVAASPQQRISIRNNFK